MNKFLFQIACVVFPLFVAGQQKSAPAIEKKWKQIHDSHTFRRNKDYKGPDGYGNISPSVIEENEPVVLQPGSSSTLPYQGQPYSSNQIRQGRYVPNAPQGGTVKPDPKISKPEPVTIPEIDPPDIDAPDIDAPDVSGDFWKYLLIVLLLVVIALIVYYAIRNRAPVNAALPFEELEENMNPATIEKTELELRLEEAEAREDFRECVRIYFLFAMKELIEKRWIFWKKDKTNIHYIIEMQGKPTAHEFEKVVGIYELVWYGDYQIDRQSYRSMEPVLEAYYKSLQALK